jgi:hypothetical protein
MVERRSHALLSWRSAALVAAVASSLVLVGCSSGSEDGACSAPNPAPPAELALMPAGLSFERVGTVTHVEKTTGSITVQAVATKPIDEVTVLIQDAVTAAGYQPSGMDNEGDEAEVFFTLGSLAAGQANVRGADCEGRWNIDLALIDRNAAGPSSTVPSR